MQSVSAIARRTHNTHASSTAESNESCQFGQFERQAENRALSNSRSEDHPFGQTLTVVRTKENIAEIFK